MVPTRVVIAAGGPAMRWLLERGLRRGPEFGRGDSLSGGREAMDRVFSLQPDVLIFDPDRSESSATEVGRRLAERKARTRVLLVTADGSEEAILRHWKRG